VELYQFQQQVVVEVVEVRALLLMVDQEVLVVVLEEIILLEVELLVLQDKDMMGWMVEIMALQAPMLEAVEVLVDLDQVDLMQLTVEQESVYLQLSKIRHQHLVQALHQ
jgi:hypothetical protein